jgi:hypothetical protein
MDDVLLTHFLVSLATLAMPRLDVTQERIFHRGENN